MSIPSSAPFVLFALHRATILFSSICLAMPWLCFESILVKIEVMTNPLPCLSSLSTLFIISIHSLWWSTSIMNTYIYRFCSWLNHLQTERSTLARGLKAFNDKVIWMAVSTEDGAISGLWNHMCTLCNGHTEQKFTHTECLLTAKKSWRTQMPLLSK